MMKVESGRIVLLVDGNVEFVAIGPWRDAAKGRFAVSPGFYLHDGTASAPRGPAVMSQASPGAGTGELTYRRERGEDIIFVPVEAFGEKRAVRSAAC